MFFINKGDIDPQNTPISQLCGVLNDTLSDPSFREMLDLKIDKKTSKKALFLVDEHIRKDKRAKKVDRDSLIAYKNGIAYGISLATKIAASVDRDELRNSPSKVSPDEVGGSIKRAMQQFAFMFYALDMAVDDWNDDHWLENLLNNVKVAAEPVSKIKKKK